MEHQLEELNHEEAKQYIGGVVFVTTIMTIGIIGNLHVLFVYTFRMKPSNHRIFILVLAVLDFITCVIGMPFIIVDLRNPLQFTMIYACKVLRFVNYFICISSAFILTVIAVDRYRKICVPLGKQVSRKLAMALCLVCLGASLLLSWPAPVLYGHSSVNTTNPNITGVRCFTEDKFKHTKYQAFFNAVLIITVFGIFAVLVVLYTLIGRQIRKHAHFTSSQSKEDIADVSSKDTCTTDESSGELSHSAVKKDKKVTNKKAVDANLSMVSLEHSSHTYSGDTEKSSEVSKSNQAKYRKIKIKSKEKSEYNRAKRTTFMLFLITIFFFISYFPHLILKIVVFVKKDFVLNLSFAGKVSYNTFVWCFFINNVVNCFIYGFCDMRFRKEVKHFYSRLFRRILK